MLLRYRIKGILLYVVYNIILLTISFLLNRFYQMLIFVLFYSFIQNCFYYRFHADTIQNDPIKAVRLCKVITIGVEITYLAFCNNLNISIYSNLFIIFLIALLNCLLEFSIESITIKTDTLKDREKLIILCNKAHLTKNATDRMIMKYVEGKTYQEIADLECVDLQTIKMSINRSRNKIFKSQE